MPAETTENPWPAESEAWFERHLAAAPVMSERQQRTIEALLTPLG